ncbi:MAG: acyl-CoA reductase [Lachnospiraceae bacterium]|nr:acyl-CoA reductase [Lachnospiraceae bacterium]
MQKSGGAAIPMELNFNELQFHIGSRKTVERMPELPAGRPFEEERIAFLNEVSKRLLSDKEAKAYSDVVTFAFWIRKANMEKEKSAFLSEHRLRMGRGVVFHIAPSNVAVNYAYSFAAGFVLGNANIVRLPSREFRQTELINRAVSEVLRQEEAYRKWGDYIVFLRYGRKKEINDYFSSICNVRVIWGGDKAIGEIRKSELPPRAGEITFADRYSICIVDAEEYLNTKDKERLAQDFYNDTYFTDQNACTSPRLVCWMGEHKRIEEAKEVFWEKLWETVERKYPFQPVQYVDKLTNSCLAAAAIEGIQVIRMKDNRIVRIELEKMTPRIQEYRGDSGVFYEYELGDVMELAPICNEKLQTIAVWGDEKKVLPLIESGVKGIDRVVKIGKTMEFGFVWDGYDLRERMTRKIGMQSLKR